MHIAKTSFTLLYQASHPRQFGHRCSNRVYPIFIILIFDHIFSKQNNLTHKLNFFLLIFNEYSKIITFYKIYSTKMELKHDLQQTRKIWVLGLDLVHLTNIAFIKY